MELDVDLSEVAVEPSSGGGHNDPPKLLLPHHIPCSFGHTVGTSHVDEEDKVPVLVSHLREGDVPQDAGVVDDDVNLSEGIECCLYDPVAKFNRVVVGHSLDAERLALLHHRICRTDRRGGGGVTGGAPTEIVHDTVGTTCREVEDMGAAQATTYPETVQ